VQELLELAMAGLNQYSDESETANQKRADWGFVAYSPIAKLSSS
jgi:hypothetical protein